MKEANDSCSAKPNTELDTVHAQYQGSPNNYATLDLNLMQQSIDPTLIKFIKHAADTYNLCEATSDKWK